MCLHWLMNLSLDFFSPLFFVWECNIFDCQVSPFGSAVRHNRRWNGGQWLPVGETIGHCWLGAGSALFSVLCETFLGETWLKFHAHITSPFAALWRTSHIHFSPSFSLLFFKQFKHVVVPQWNPYLFLGRQPSQSAPWYEESTAFCINGFAQRERLPAVQKFGVKREGMQSNRATVNQSTETTPMKY